MCPKNRMIFEHLRVITALIVQGYLKQCVQRQQNHPVLISAVTFGVYLCHSHELHIFII